MPAERPTAVVVGGGIAGLASAIALSQSGWRATVRRLGMEWVGETEKYHHLRLQEFRLRPADLGDGTASAP